MSTRASIYYTPNDKTHLFEDVMEDFETSGLHLDFTPDFCPDTGQYGDFELTMVAGGKVQVSLRIPFDVCVAIAKYVEHRKANPPDSWVDEV